MPKDTKKLIIHGSISLAIYLIVSNVPAQAPLTDIGIQVLGIMLGLIYGLCTLEPAIPAIGSLILFGLTGYTTVFLSFMSAFGHFAVVMILSLMFFASIMVKSGLAQILAERIVNSKIANGRPKVLTLLILLAAMIPSMFLTATPVLIIVWDIMKNIFNIAGFKKGDKWPSYMIAGVTAVSAISISAMPFAMGIATDWSILTNIDPTMTIPSISFVFGSLVICAAFLLLFWLIICFVLRPDVSKLKDYKVAEKVKFNRDQKRALVLLVSFVVLVILPDALPMGTLKIFLSQFGVTGNAFLMVLIALIIRNKDGSHFVKFSDVTEGVYWPMLLMICAVMGVCGVVSDPMLGITDWLSVIMQPIVAKLTPFGFYALIIGLAVVGTNLLDNAVVGLVSVPIIYTLSQSMGVTTIGFVAMTLRAAEYGVLTPASSPLGALTYGQIESGWTDKKGILTISLIGMVLVYVVLLTLGYPLCMSM